MWAFSLSSVYDVITAVNANASITHLPASSNSRREGDSSAGLWWMSQTMQRQPEFPPQDTPRRNSC